MDRYNQLKKLFNMSEETKTKTNKIPTWYARLKTNNEGNRIFSNAITNPNSQIIKALLFANFKLPLSNNYNNIVDIFREVSKSNYAEQELIEYTTNSSNGVVTLLPTPQTIQRRPLTDSNILDCMTVDIADWWAERIEVYRCDENRSQRSTESPDLDMRTILDNLIEGIEYENLDDLEEYIDEASKDPDGNAYYEEQNVENVDEEYVDTIDEDFGYDLRETHSYILSRLRNIMNGDNNEYRIVSEYIREKTRNERTLNDLIEHMEENI